MAGCVTAFKAVIDNPWAISHMPVKRGRYVRQRYKGGPTSVRPAPERTKKFLRAASPIWASLTWEAQIFSAVCYKRQIDAEDPIIKVTPGLTA